MSSKLFGGKSVPGSVRAEIAARSGPRAIQWNAKKFPWIHVMSCSADCGLKLTSQFGPLYEAGYKRPKPTVSKVSVKKQGELGTTRKATVGIVAYTDEQLVQLQACFFIPGMTVRVQWGWSVSATGVNAPAPITGCMPDARAVCQMNAMSAGNPGAYEGLQGVVGNFKYGLTQEGYWDCEVEVIAASNAVATARMDTHDDDDCAREYKQTDPKTGDEKEVVAKRSSLYTKFFDLIHEFNVARGVIASTVGPIAAGGAQIYKMRFEGEDRNEIGGSEQSFWSFGNYDTEEPFVSYGTLEAMINAYCIPTNGGPSSPDKFVVGMIRSDDIRLPATPSLDSTDPRICILNGGPYSSQMLSDGAKGPTAVSGNEVILNNIMINVIFLCQEFDKVEKGDGLIMTFIRNVLDRINKCCGGLWEFDFASSTESCDDPNRPPTVTVIDARKYKPGSTFSLPSLPDNSVLRDFKLDMKMTDQMKSQALYSNSSGQTTGKSQCDLAKFEPFGLVKGVDSAKPKAITKPKSDCGSSSAKAKEPSLAELIAEVKDVVEDGTCSAAESAMAAAVAKEAGDSPAATCAGMVLPFEFSFTLDGMGGFRFGQLVTSDRIPSRVASKYDWQVTTSEHEVTIQDWTTTVQTVCRYKGA